VSDPWEELVSVALMGTDRRHLDVDVLPDVVRDNASRLDVAAPEALLATASLVHAAERAGRRAAPAQPLEPAGAGTTTEAAGAAAATLARILQSDDLVLLAEWLGLAAETGHHATHQALPALLDLGTAHSAALRAPVAAALGERGRWLAALRPEWGAVLAVSRRDETVPDPWAAEELWSHGDLAQRTAWLRAARADDARRALETLRAGWGAEAPAERAAFVAELGAQLGPDDEAFLEPVLDDSRAEVRRAAADLLRVLSGSAYSERMLARATAWVRIERGLLRSRLVVEPVDERDAALKRDQVPDPPKGSGGRRAWFLEQVLARVDPARFAAALGADADGVVKLAAGSDWSAPLLAGLSAAASATGDVAWCRGLVGHDPTANLALVGRLPAQEQARAIRASTASGWDAGGLLRLAQELPRPWPSDVATSFVAVVAQARDPHPSLLRPLLDAVAHAADASDAGPVLAALRDRVSAYAPGSANWSAASAALDVLTTRHRMREELT
jgi:hypothetical protein